MQLKALGVAGLLSSLGQHVLVSFGAVQRVKFSADAAALLALLLLLLAAAGHLCQRRSQQPEQAAGSGAAGLSCLCALHWHGRGGPCCLQAPGLQLPQAHEPRFRRCHCRGAGAYCGWLRCLSCLVPSFVWLHTTKQNYCASAEGKPKGISMGPDLSSECVGLAAALMMVGDGGFTAICAATAASCRHWHRLQLHI